MEDSSYYFSDFFIKLLTFDYFYIKKVIKNEGFFNNRLNILDFGCGTGTLAYLFNKRNYIGFDLDSQAISFAKKKFPGYKFEVGDATKVEFKKKFDRVLIVGVLHHLKDSEIKKASFIISKLLTKEGKALIIEATHPIWSFNIIGLILRKLDKGTFVRSVIGYSNLLSGSLKICKKYQQKGGILDYAVIVANTKSN